MKHCPKCQRSYTDALRFCPKDGEPLSESEAGLEEQSTAAPRPARGSKAARPARCDSPPVNAAADQTPAEAVPWERVDQLLELALERESGERDVFLAEACGGDEALRREVESLLAAHKQASGFLDEPALQVAAEDVAEGRAKFSVGRRVSHYRIVSMLGAGGMGEVYLAEDTRLGRKVALKILPAQFTQDADRAHRFEQEARAASALNHPNIITIYDIDQADEVHFIATEFIDGQTLRKKIGDAGMPVREALEIAVQVASALSAAHEAGIVHRDIKPENVMLRRDGYVKVLDFGLAKLTERQTPTNGTDAPTREGSLTDPGMVIGTVTYMSPEQARGLKADHRSDIFSLGVVIYEMITGRVPFAGLTMSDVIALILRSEPLPPVRYAPETPAELQRIVMKALVKDREARYQTIKDFALDLKSLAQEMEFQSKLARVRSPEATSKPVSNAEETIASSGQATPSSNPTSLTCPNCQAINPGTAKFCLNCGSPVVNRGSNCQADLPTGVRFCLSCGQQVGGITPADDARLSRMAAATPFSLANKIRAAGQPTGERKVVTALFAG